MRHEYRIKEIRNYGTRYYTVEIRRWYWPFWVKLDWINYFMFSDVAKLEFKSLVFDNIEEAKSFATDFSIRGKEAFIEYRHEPVKDKFTYLGRLP